MRVLLLTAAVLLVPGAAAAPDASSPIAPDVAPEIARNPDPDPSECLALWAEFLRRLIAGETNLTVPDCVP